jgi:hypothetical protein
LEPNKNKTLTPSGTPPNQSPTTLKKEATPKKKGKDLIKESDGVQFATLFDDVGAFIYYYYYYYYYLPFFLLLVTISDPIGVVIADNAKVRQIIVDKQTQMVSWPRNVLALLTRGINTRLLLLLVLLVLLVLALLLGLLGLLVLVLLIL